MRQKTMYSVPGTNLADSDDYNQFRKFADEMGYENIELKQISVPWLEDGDQIIINLCVGSSQDEDGIVTGGKWVDTKGTWRVSTGKYAHDGIGSMYDNKDNHIQTVDADMRYDGFPYRNVRVVQPENTTVENHTLRVTLPTKTFNKIGRYGVFNDAMIILGNKSELEILKSEGVDPDEINDLAVDSLIIEYLENHGRYSKSETLVRAHGGHRMSPRMEADYCAAKAYATAKLADPETAKSWIDSAIKTLKHIHDTDVEYRTARSGWHKDWKIEIIGKMPGQIGLCRIS